MSDEKSRAGAVCVFVSHQRINGDVPDNYKEYFDADGADLFIDDLKKYLMSYASENNPKALVSRKENELHISSDFGSRLEISVWHPEVFDIARWPASHEEYPGGDKVFWWEWASEADSDTVIYLAREFIRTGRLFATA